MRTRFLQRAALAVLAVLWSTLAAADMPTVRQAQAVPESQAQIDLSFSPLVKRVAPAVVNIYAQRTVRRQTGMGLFDDPFFRRFFGDSPFGGFTRERIENSLGSGVVVRPEGLVVTNHHVISEAEEIKVVLADRREYPAELVLSDERTDLAVLRVRLGGAGPLPHLDLGDSDALEVGDLVLAVGNPFGVGQTVTSGIVSGLARTSVGVSDYRFFIQTDAAINPGNSGGALVGMDGRLIGVNTAIYSRTGGSLGIGFAVPSNMVRTILASAESGRPLVRPWLSLSGRPVTSELAQVLGLQRPVGVVVERVHPQGPAAAAGIQAGDVVTAVGGHDVDDLEALRFRIATGRIGDAATLRIVRRGQERTVNMALVAPPEVPPREETVLEGSHPLTGANVANLSPAVADEMGLQEASEGVVVLGVRRGSPAHRLGFQPHDIVREVNGVQIDRVQTLRRALTSTTQWRMRIRRGERDLLLELSG